MLRGVSIMVALTLVAAAVSAQSTTRPKYLDHAVIQHSGSTATVTADFPVPIFQAISGMREEYGWRLDWEGAPCYCRFDVVDDTGPKWRAAHPDAKGVARPTGGLLNRCTGQPLYRGFEFLPLRQFL
jgi:hypothetical protein